MPGPSGVLVIDKPAGPTSFDVVRRVSRALDASTAGHAGTLDPAATGVLAVCVGDAVKLQQFLMDGDKAYEATVALGAATDTEDGEGRVIARGDPGAVTADALRAAAARLVGWIDQIPPMYSAVRVGGRRLHRAARAGEAVERAPRRVRVDAFDLVDLAPPADGLALARFTVRCGKGTYVRTLAVDVGRAVGVPAHLAALRRTMSSGFRIEQAIPLDAAEALAREDAEALRARLVSLADALGFVPALPLSWQQALDLVHGRPVARPPGAPAGVTRALAPDGRLVAVCGPGDGRLRTLRVLLGPADLRPPAVAPEH
ncbi:tRNA pseudouridine(55) synthase TruB [Anaeromyxobacter oryzisoli]|uniref:tRNA pseudouridine(55) synthase TruB n=1 Tax=Anaeromyxobacter oryzisoli TaxID=2925408 RepID=UPI001F591F39|nr:tRNA pseudouridine(55) synthase TruB [Anaeromyxobacter sp. SG63]